MTPVVTVVDTSPYVVTIQVTADHQGSLSNLMVAVMELDVLHYALLTALVVANA